MDIARGFVEGFSNMLMKMEMREPRPIWIAPINEDAVPAFFSKGANVKEAVFGFMMPIQDSNKKIKKMSRGSESHPIPEESKKNMLSML